MLVWVVFTRDPTSLAHDNIINEILVSGINEVGRRQLPVGCSNIAFLTFLNYHADGGTFVQNTPNVELCKGLCQANSSCHSADWNKFNS